jgi:hypothetical protein
MLPHLDLEGTSSVEAGADVVSISPQPVLEVA